MSRLNDELIKRGYDDKYRGTRYIRAAVGLALAQPAARGISMTKEAYPTIAKVAGVSPAAVERGIRFAVAKAEPGRTNAGVVHEIAAVVRAYED